MFWLRNKKNIMWIPSLMCSYVNYISGFRSVMLAQDSLKNASTLAKAVVLGQTPTNNGMYIRKLSWKTFAGSWEVWKSYICTLPYVMSPYGLCHEKMSSGHMRAEKTQISSHICAVWSGPSLSANRISEHYRLQYNLNGSNTDGSFTVDDSNSFFSSYKILSIAQENKYLWIFSYFIMELSKPF